MRRLALEVIASSVEDAVEAARGGAHRLEIVRDLSRAGLTPAIELVQQIQREVALPLRVMVRESDGFACGSNDECRMLVDQGEKFYCPLLFRLRDQQGGDRQDRVGMPPGSPDAQINL